MDEVFQVAFEVYTIDYSERLHCRPHIYDDQSKLQYNVSVGRVGNFPGAHFGKEWGDGDRLRSSKWQGPRNVRLEETNGVVPHHHYSVNTVGVAHDY